MKQIRVLDNTGQEYVYPVNHPTADITIGRSQQNDIILGSKTVSRRHAILKIMGDRILLVNQSPNGVLVNGQRIDRAHELRPGEFAQIDVYQICVEDPNAMGSGVGRPPMQSGFNQSAPQPSMMNAPPIQQAPQHNPQQFSAPGPPPGQPPQQRGPVIRQNQPSKPGMRGPAPSSAPPAAAPSRPALTEAQEEARFEAFLNMLVPRDYEEPRVALSGEASKVLDRKRRRAVVQFKARLHEELKDRLDLHSFQITDYRTPRTVKQVAGKLKELLDFYAHEVPPPYTRDDVFKEMMDEVCGLGPIEDLLKHKGVTEVMVVDREHIYAEINGQLVLTDRTFNDEKSMMTVIERIVIPRGRRIDETTPLVDTRLSDGSRVNAVIPPLALKDPCLTIRKFPEDRLGMRDLVKFGSLTREMGKFIARSVRVRKNIVISGGTGSGKTTLLNVMSGFIGLQERVVTIEDAAELQLQQEHVVSLETKPPNLEGKGEIAIRDLVKNALRMRPDRIVVGECRGGEALDMLQAMNTGHDGSMTTVHSNSPIEAIARLETLVMMSGMELPSRAIREQIANSVDVIVQQTRFSDGSRRVSYISEVVGIDDDGWVHIEDIYRYRQMGVDEDHKVYGYHLATGYLPSFLNEFVVQGLADKEDFF